MRTKNEIQNELKSKIKDWEDFRCSTEESPDEHIFQGWVEALEFVLSDPEPLVNKEQQSRLNKIADAYLYRNYPGSLNGIFSYAEVFDKVTDHDPDGHPQVLFIVNIKFGRQDDCYNEIYRVEIGVFEDDLIKCKDGDSLPYHENPEY